MKQIRLPLLLSVALAAGILIGSSFSNSTKSEEFSSGIQKLREVLMLIDQNYVDEVEMDKLVETAITEMLDELDPHSAYIPPEDKRQANEDLQGNFEGIGIEFNIFRDTIVVVSPLSGGPSEAVGLQSGDRIVNVDGETVAGTDLSYNDVYRYLKGPKGSKVELGVKRRGQDKLLKFEIIRDKIPQYSVDVGYMVDEETGYIKISRFSATTYDEFMEKLTALKERGMKNLILDLQGNPGGYMQMAVAIADEFLPQGQKIVYTKSKKTMFDADENAQVEGSFETGPLYILVDGGSASASEIVAGAIQDNDRGLIVGRRTFGKGLVQLPMDLKDGSELRLTISRYYTPSGRSIQTPYEETDDYYRDYLDRFNNGEYFHADSIEFADSLKFTTRNGRTVYGGGGIMPDYFVPLDTARYSDYLNSIYNAIQEYSFKYAQAHEDRLEQMGLNRYMTDFRVTDEMLENLMETGREYGHDPNPVEIEKHKTLFQLHLKAQIARRIWGFEGLYPILNNNNEAFQNAVKLINNSVTLEEGRM